MNSASMHKPLQTLEGGIVTAEVSQPVAGYSLFTRKAEECGICGHNESLLGSSD